MIIDGYRFAKYLNDTGLRAEEFWLLYRVMLQEQNISDGILKVPGIAESEATFQFSKWSQIYQEKGNFYLGVGIDWIQILKKLESEGYVELWNKRESEIKLTEVKVTDKFKKHFLISDIEQAFYELVEIYPTWIEIKGNRYPAQDKSPEELAKLYDKHILKGGNMLLHHRCIILTEKYIKGRDSKHAPYKLSNYISEAFEGIASGLEKDNQTENSFSEEV